jgi:hypothetical protein
VYSKQPLYWVAAWGRCHEFTAEAWLSALSAFFLNGRGR